MSIIVSRQVPSLILIVWFLLTRFLLTRVRVTCYCLPSISTFIHLISTFVSHPDKFIYTTSPQLLLDIINFYLSLFTCHGASQYRLFDIIDHTKCRWLLRVTSSSITQKANPGSDTMALVTQFLTGVRKKVLALEDEALKDWLRVEPPVPDVYHQLGAELRSSFPSNTDALQKLIDKCLPEEDDVPEGRGSPWPGLNSFVNEYMEYWRDVDFNNAVTLYTQLSNLLK